jgi:hypothetical protein
MSQVGVLSKKGQHMSLPLSWVVLSALNTTAAMESRHLDKDIKIFTMGDDCVYACRNKNSIIKYHKNLLSYGFLINQSKDVTSTIGRAVFCEHLVSREEGWLDRVRPKIITHPKVDVKGSAWISLRAPLTKWWSEDKKSLVRKLQQSYFALPLRKAIERGLAPGLPREFGGFDLPIRTKWDESYKLVISNIQDPKSLLELDQQCQRTLLTQGVVSYGGLLNSMLTDKEYYISSRRADKWQSHELNQLLIECYLPYLIYQPSFERLPYIVRTPEEIGSEMRAIYSEKSNELIPQYSVSEQVKKRHSVRIRSSTADHFKRMSLEDFRFWK